MISAFSKLNSQEIDLMKQVPALVTILIAGADKKVEKVELREAIMLAKANQSRSREILKEFYTEVAIDFEKQLTEMMGYLPADADKRNAAVSKQLEMINPILPKLDQAFSSQFYASMKDFAKKVAEASGGIFGSMSISYEEAKLIELKMINDPS